MLLALSLLSVLPVRPGTVDRAAAGRAMTVAPAAGGVLAVLAAVPAVLVLRLDGGPLLAAVATTAALAALTRGLHLDGLADTADGLGSARPTDEALAVMKRSDVGPFGVVTLVLVLLLDVAALAQAWAAGAAYGAATVVVAAVTGRCAVTVACRTGVPAARPDGLGAWVAGTVRPAVAVTVAVACAGGAALLLAVTAGPASAAAGGLAVVAGLATAGALERRCRHRLGGITGDVLGALVETGTAAALLVLALAA